MPERPSKRSRSLVSTDTKITTVFVVLAIVAVFGTTSVIDRQWIHFAVLIGVGVITPTLINEWRK
jgi:hypothetical protein